VVWSEPNKSQIEAWSLSIYAWYQEFEFKKEVAKLKIKKNNKKNLLILLCTCSHNQLPLVPKKVPIKRW
jgi:hypothetical protein